MKISEIISFLESLADLSLQEPYDNSGLLTGDGGWDCSAVLCTLDATEEVVKEAIERKCNLIVAHHPIIFQGLKKINGRNYVEKTVIRAIKNDIAIYAIHTNLDNVIGGVSGKMARLVGLKNVSVLQSKEDTLKKIYTYVPVDKVEMVRNAIFAAGGGNIGNYSECSFNTEGTGSFNAGAGAKPYVGERGVQHLERETRIEVIFPSFLEDKIVLALKAAHPYEEVAFEVIQVINRDPATGSGVMGELPEALDEKSFLLLLKGIFNLTALRHSVLLNRPVKKVAFCGGAGSFLISRALAAGADAFVTADIKYHEFFEANNRILIADIGHYESEQFTINLLYEVLEQKFPNFAVLKTAVVTNPVKYF